MRQWPAWKGTQVWQTHVDCITRREPIERKPQCMFSSNSPILTKCFLSHFYGRLHLDQVIVWPNSWSCVIFKILSKWWVKPVFFFIRSKNTHPSVSGPSKDVCSALTPLISDLFVSCFLSFINLVRDTKDKTLWRYDARVLFYWNKNTGLSFVLKNRRLLRLAPP